MRWIARTALLRVKSGCEGRCGWRRRDLPPR